MIRHLSFWFWKFWHTRSKSNNIVNIFTSFLMCFSLDWWKASLFCWTSSGFEYGNKHENNIICAEPKNVLYWNGHSHLALIKIRYMHLLNLQTTHYPTYLLIYKTLIFLKGRSLRCNLMVIQWRSIQNWVIKGFHWMVC
jgi:hypothetical protein